MLELCIQIRIPRVRISIAEDSIQLAIDSVEMQPSATCSYLVPLWQLEEVVHGDNQNNLKAFTMVR